MRPAALLAAALLALAVPACGGEDESGSSRAGDDGGQASETKASAPQSPAQSVRSYGAEADGEDETSIATVVKDFYAAKAAGHGAQVCTLLARATREALIETLAQSGRGKGCGAILAPLLADQAPQYRDRIAGVEVTGARVRDDRGLALIHIEAIPEEVIPVRREDGSWKVAALAGSEIP